MTTKKALGIITARGGSKGLPGKNIKLLNGKPLIEWTIERALSSKNLTKVMVTTDCPEIAAISEKAGAEIPFLRPAKFANDTASSVTVINHVLAHYDNRGEFFDYIVLLEPTSPLREADDIDNMLKKVFAKESEGYNGILAIGEAAHPSILRVKQGDHLLPYDSSLQIYSHRQDAQKVYFPFGVAYIVKTDVFRKNQTFYPDNMLFYELKKYQWYEIDDIYDFLAVENIMKYQWFPSN